VDNVAVLPIDNKIGKEILHGLLETAARQPDNDTEYEHIEYTKRGKKYDTFAAQQIFKVDNLFIQPQENSVRFLLLNENNKSVTAYEIIKRLSEAAFKSYDKQIKFKNNKIPEQRTHFILLAHGTANRVLRARRRSPRHTNKQEAVKAS
jgi:hypothetical protein